MASKDFLYCEETDTKIYSGDVVTISSFPDVRFIAKQGWYKIGTAQQRGWYFVNIADRTTVPMDQVDITTISKVVEQGTSEYRPTLKDIDATPAEVNYLVIPGTNIRLYDGDIVKISVKPKIKWVVHAGWYIYDGVQNFGWYFVSIKDGTILPVSIIDLTLCTLVTTKTQGSEKYDGKVVNYTRPFTIADAEVLNRTFITVDTLDQRDSLDKNKLVNGRMVRVNDVGGAVIYYAWNATTEEWEKIDDSGQGLPKVEGTEDSPIILSELPEGLYLVTGYYKISPEDHEVIETNIDHLSFINYSESNIYIKVVDETHIKDYTVKNGEVTFYTEYATTMYVDDKISALELRVPEIVEEILSASLEPISSDYINSLFE